MIGGGGCGICNYCLPVMLAVISVRWCMVMVHGVKLMMAAPGVGVN